MPTWPDPLRQQLSREAAFGWTYEDMGRLHGKSPESIRQYLKRPDMLELVEHYSSQLQLEARQALIEWQQQFLPSVRNLRNVANNPDHKDHYKANEKFVDSLIPKATTRTEGDIVHHLDGDARAIVTDVLTTIKEVIGARNVVEIEQSPYLKEGPDALPAAAREQRFEKAARELTSGNGSELTAPTDDK